MYKKNLAIYGAGGLGSEIYELASRINEKFFYWERIVLLSDRKEDIQYCEVINLSSLIDAKDKYECIVAVGEPSSRELLYNKLIQSEVNIAKLVDPTSLISKNAYIGKGSIVCEYSTIHHGVSIGENCLIQPYCCIGHDINIGKHVVISAYSSPGGNAVFEDLVFCGMHSVIKERIKLGRKSIIGMGAVVFHDVGENNVVIGNPARITRGNESGKVFK